MTDHLEQPDRIVLAADMALHFGLALGSTVEGVFASMHYDLGAGSAHRNDTMGRRFELVVEKVEAFVAAHVDAVDEAIYEQPTPNSHGAAATQWRLIGAFELACERLRIRVSGAKVYPSTLKKWATAYGACDKSAMLEAANQITETYPVRDHNEADAVCLCAMHLDRVRQREAKRLARQLAREATT